ncbi:hypothetical protein QYF61_014668 [Mycteria americana]|uniref:Uncharacterized protein n=1 Tax=Mycteria americana TaxID=33587 RepID=A0AAN7P1Z0_MYCAM|nr:hypothetical protein QYF61_014668 [Mycteria americana]
MPREVVESPSLKAIMQISKAHNQAKGLTPLLLAPFSPPTWPPPLWLRGNMEAQQWVSAHPKGLPCCAFGCLSLGQLRSLAAFWQSGDKGALPSPSEDPGDCLAAGWLPRA